MSELGFDTLKTAIAFKSGTSPLEAVEYLNVGREVWHEGTTWYLDDFVDGGRSAVRFVQGVYGEGKTHFLYLTAKAALDRNYVVSYVTADTQCCAGWHRPSSGQRNDSTASWAIAISGLWKRLLTPLRPPARRRRSNINLTAAPHFQLPAGHALVGIFSPLLVRLRH